MEEEISKYFIRGFQEISGAIKQFRDVVEEAEESKIPLDQDYSLRSAGGVLQSHILEAFIILNVNCYNSKYRREFTRNPGNYTTPTPLNLIDRTIDLFGETNYGETMKRRKENLPKILIEL